MKPSTEERFWAKVDRRGPDECWRWQAAHNSLGYASFSVGGRVGGGHRFAYELLVGPIPEGLVIDHLCRVRDCVNPAHMEPVTQRTNVLRGEAPAARQAAQDQCQAGHPLVHMASGRRGCVECTRARARLNQREYRQRRALSAALGCDPDGRGVAVRPTQSSRATYPVTP